MTSTIIDPDTDAPSSSPLAGPHHISRALCSAATRMIALDAVINAGASRLALDGGPRAAGVACVQWLSLGCALRCSKGYILKPCLN